MDLEKVLLCSEVEGNKIQLVTKQLQLLSHKQIVILEKMNDILNKYLKFREGMLIVFPQQKMIQFQLYNILELLAPQLTELPKMQKQLKTLEYICIFEYVNLRQFVKLYTLIYLIYNPRFQYKYIKISVKEITYTQWWFTGQILKQLNHMLKMRITLLIVSAINLISFFIRLTLLLYVLNNSLCHLESEYITRHQAETRRIKQIPA